MTSLFFPIYPKQNLADLLDKAADVFQDGI